MTAQTDWPAPSSRRASPLSAWLGRLAAASAAPARFTIREIQFSTQINLRGDAVDTAFASAVRSTLGTNLPTRPNTWSGTRDCEAIWLGPDEWLVVSADGADESLFSRLHVALQGLHHALTDVSANRTVLEISGNDARSVLAKGCSLDLHKQAFGERQSAQTLLAKSPVILQCMDGHSAFRLYVRNSFAQYLAMWLTDAQAECAASSGLDATRIASRLG